MGEGGRGGGGQEEERENLRSVLDFTLNMWPINTGWTKNGDSGPLGILLNSLLIVTWQNMTAFTFQIGGILLSLPMTRNISCVQRIH